MQIGDFGFPSSTSFNGMNTVNFTGANTVTGSLLIDSEANTNTVFLSGVDITENLDIQVGGVDTQNTVTIESTTVVNGLIIDFDGEDTINTLVFAGGGVTDGGNPDALPNPADGGLVEVTIPSGATNTLEWEQPEANYVNETGIRGEFEPNTGGGLIN